VERGFPHCLRSALATIAATTDVPARGRCIPLFEQALLRLDPHHPYALDVLRTINAFPLPGCRRGTDHPGSVSLFALLDGQNVAVLLRAFLSTGAWSQADWLWEAADLRAWLNGTLNSLTRSQWLERCVERVFDHHLSVPSSPPSSPSPERRVHDPLRCLDWFRSHLDREQGTWLPYLIDTLLRHGHFSLAVLRALVDLDPLLLGAYHNYARLFRNPPWGDPLVADLDAPALRWMWRAATAVFNKPVSPPAWKHFPDGTFRPCRIFDYGIAFTLACGTRDADLVDEIYTLRGWSPVVVTPVFRHEYETSINCHFIGDREAVRSLARSGAAGAPLLRWFLRTPPPDSVDRFVLLIEAYLTGTDQAVPGMRSDARSFHRALCRYLDLPVRTAPAFTLRRDGDPEPGDQE
jgi:hypothetical protein